MRRSTCEPEFQNPSHERGENEHATDAAKQRDSLLLSRQRQLTLLGREGQQGAARSLDEYGLLFVVLDLQRFAKGQCTEQGDWHNLTFRHNPIEVGDPNRHKLKVRTSFREMI